MPGPEHWAVRDGIYAYHRMIAGPTAGVLIGNSISEGFWWSQIGTARLVNAGFGGIGTADLASRASAIIGASQPQFVIIMTGTNDAYLADGETVIPQARLTAFSTALQTILAAARQRCRKTVLVSVPPIEPGKSLSVIRSQVAVNQLNAIITQKATANRLKLVNLNYRFMVGGVGKAGYTLDGIHFTRTSYVILYNDLVTALR